MNDEMKFFISLFFSFLFLTKTHTPNRLLVHLFRSFLLYTTDVIMMYFFFFQETPLACQVVISPLARNCKSVSGVDFVSLKTFKNFTTETYFCFPFCCTLNDSNGTAFRGRLTGNMINMPSMRSRSLVKG